jgi:hypothetical protein
MRAPTRRVSRAATWARRLGTFAAILGIVAIAAHRLGPSEGLPGVAVAGVVLATAGSAVLLAVFALAAIWRSGDDGAGAAFVGLVWGAATLVPMMPAVVGAASFPSLSQVTTDLADPPAFVWAARERPPGANDPDRLDPDQAALQGEAYPTIVPLRVDAPAAEAYQMALALVAERRWRVLDRRAPQNRIPGRIEAVARTQVYGFRDDIVIRVTPLGADARIDMRSASRFGHHDFGENARRVIAFMTELRDRIADR